MSTEARVGRRLQRILLLVPYAINHPGISLDELARAFDIRRSELTKDLDLLFLCGLPGYGPGDLIDVDLSGDRVFIRMADYFSAPLRLSAAEGLALYASGVAISSLPGMEKADALRRALEKLSKALGLDGSASAVDVELHGGGLAHLEILQEALDAERTVHLEYFTAGRDEMTERDVDPWGLVAALGRWYLVGLDHLSHEERMFRLDRIKKVTMLDAAAPRPDDFDPGAYRSAWREQSSEEDGKERLSMEVSPEVSRWFGDYYPLLSSTPLEDGWTRVELTSSGDRWAAALVLRLGGGVRSVEPSRIRGEAARMAGLLLDRHSGPATGD